LRFDRQQRGLSLGQLGQILNAAPSTVANVEACRRRIDERQARGLDRAWNTGGLFELLLWYARTAHDPDWFRQYSHYEAMARTIKIYHGQAIPGPLQTDSYTRALAAMDDPERVEAAVAEWAARKQSIFERDDPPFVWALIDESVLALRAGSAKTMKDQLQHLLDLSQMPRASVRIVPTISGVHFGLDGPFQVISLDSRDVAYSGAQNGGRLVEGTSEVKEFAIKFERISAKAASEDGSRDLIEQYLGRCP
jgi:hypothetical protein